MDIQFGLEGGVRVYFERESHGIRLEVKRVLKQSLAFPQGNVYTIAALFDNIPLPHPILFHSVDSLSVVTAYWFAIYELILPMDYLCAMRQAVLDETLPDDVWGSFAIYADSWLGEQVPMGGYINYEQWHDVRDVPAIAF